MLNALRSHLHHHLRPLQHSRILIRHLHKRRRDHYHRARRRSTPTTTPTLLPRRSLPLILERRGLGKDQDTDVGGGFEDLSHVLTAGAIAVVRVGPGRERAGKGGGGGRDVGVALGEVLGVVFGGGAQVGA